MARVEINFENGGRNGSFVKVDGKLVNGVTDVRVGATVGGLPTVDIEVIATDGYVKIDEAATEITPTVVQQERRL